MSLTHFSHSHPLMRRDDFDEKRKILCSMCADEITEGVYFSCKNCPRLFLHKSCSELPQVIRHIFHPVPDHALIQIDAGPKYRKEPFYNRFEYRCYACSFVLDVKLATLVPVENPKKLSHPHPLTVCKQSQNFEMECSGCKQSLDKRGEWDHVPSPIYACRKCELLLDESCADLPQQIAHPFHPRHPLALFWPKTWWDVLICSACGNHTKLGFKCPNPECKFALDAPCASLMHAVVSVSDSAAGGDHQQDVSQNVRRHPHPLIICDVRTVKNFGPSRSCFGCRLPLINYVAFCCTCETLFHKTCTKLPCQIQHPSHPLHPLTLRDSVDYIRMRSLSSFLCNLCMSDYQCFAYRCDPCDFDIELRCASRPTAYPMIKSQLHEHSLVYSNCTPSGREYGRCTKCSLKFEYPFFHCYRCQFHLHAHCLSDSDLPPTIKHKCHLHSLNLTYSPIRDRPEEDENAELYCDACEERRLLRDPTYYCEECHYVAHVHCVISEVISYIREMETVAKERNKLKLDTLATNDVCADSESQVGDAKGEVKGEVNESGDEVYEIESEVDENESEDEVYEIESEVGAGKVDDQMVAQHVDSVLLAKVEEEIAALTTKIASLSTEVATFSTKLSDAKEKRAQLIASQTLGTRGSST